jgi:rubrerythrin
MAHSPSRAERPISRRGLLFARAGLTARDLTPAVIDALNFALRLEYLESELYTRGLAASGLIPSADRPVFTQIAKHETAHVALLRGVLGSAAITKPPMDLTARGTFGDVLSNYVTFKLVAQALEDIGVRAYQGQAGALMGSAVLTTALQIQSVEARHSAEVRRLRGQKGWVTANHADVSVLAPVYAGEQNVEHGPSEAFDEPLSMPQVLAIVAPFFP